MKEELLYQIALCHAEGIGPIIAKNLIGYTGSAKAIFEAPTAKLKKIPGVGDKAILALRSKDILIKAEEQLLGLEKHQVNTLFFTEKEYPQRLLHCPDAPIMLYVKGSLDFNARRIISVVGTRNCTKNGQRLVNELIEALGKLNVVVVSGLAYGIDICAHKAALREQLPTIAVLAHGLDAVYPYVHKKYGDEMVANGGALISEYEIGVAPDRNHFPSRNRIVAGMTDATIVIESAARGGSLITAHLAFDYNRDVFAYPGRVTDQYSRGCNNLIQRNIAKLVNEPKEIIDHLSWGEENTSQLNQSSKQLQIPMDLSEEESIVFELLNNGGDSVHVNELSLSSKLPHSKLAAVLLSLEFKGLIDHLPGNSYSIIP